MKQNDMICGIGLRLSCTVRDVKSVDELPATLYGRWNRGLLTPSTKETP